MPSRSLPTRGPSYLAWQVSSWRCTAASWPRWSHRRSARLASSTRRRRSSARPRTWPTPTPCTFPSAHAAECMHTYVRRRCAYTMNFCLTRPWVTAGFVATVTCAQTWLVAAVKPYLNLGCYISGYDVFRIDHYAMLVAVAAAGYHMYAADYSMCGTPTATTWLYIAISSYAGPHMVHCHTVHLALGALLMTCTMCGTGDLLPARRLELPRVPHGGARRARRVERLRRQRVGGSRARGEGRGRTWCTPTHRAPSTRCTADLVRRV